MTDASKLVTQALEAVRHTSKAFARRMGISDTALRRYGYGDRTPPAPVLTEFARLLRQHARRLKRVSDALAKFARKEAKGLWAQRRRGPTRRRKAKR